MTPLQELENAPEHSLPSPTILYRVQSIKVRPGAAVIGPLKLPPAGTLANRFDLPGDDVGYFAEADSTAVYETLARREATTLSLSGEIALRELLTLQTTQPLSLLDLRGKAHDWPVLQSLRYGVTQALADNVFRSGYAGVVYKSAQQFDSDCFALFSAATLGTLHLVAQAPLLHPTRHTPHRAVFDAIRGSQVTLTP